MDKRIKMRDEINRLNQQIEELENELDDTGCRDTLWGEQEIDDLREEIVDLKLERDKKIDKMTLKTNKLLEVLKESK